VKTGKKPSLNYLFASLILVVAVLTAGLSSTDVPVAQGDRGRWDLATLPRVPVPSPSGGDLLAQAAALPSETATVVPDRLKVPAAHVLSLEAQATGVQIYECGVGKDDPTRFEWVLKAPEAELFNSAGERIGRHYAGPTWESNDGSKVVGEVKALHGGSEPSAIPWLLLSATATSGNVFGVFSGTQSIQRVRTSGGRAPAHGCNRTQIGKETREPFKAAYYFYGR